MLHKKFVRHIFLQSVHNDIVKSIKFTNSNHTIISSSDDTDKSIVISDPFGTKNTYKFTHLKVKNQNKKNFNTKVRLFLINRDALVLIMILICIH